eukprot:6044431-Amphidinium_carterae.1
MELPCFEGKSSKSWYLVQNPSGHHVAWDAKVACCNSRDAIPKVMAKTMQERRSLRKLAN